MFTKTAKVSEKVRFSWEVSEKINDLLWGMDAPSMDLINLIDIYSIDLFPYYGMSVESTALMICNGILDHKFNWSIADWVKVQSRHKHSSYNWYEAVNFNIRLIKDWDHGDYVPDKACLLYRERMSPIMSAIELIEE
jgi:hypothetical protein